jgi:2-polyprenyl-6-methoxyphenol hydroxylase-like FAD-dependent oxidoreductase
MGHDRPRVLVTGASIAGPALAWGLLREGFEPVLLERSPQRRSAGQNIDVRGLGREVLRRMGIEAVVGENLTGERGTRFARPDGRVYAELPATGGHDGPTAEIEILRGVFADILLDRVEGDVETRFGDLVDAVDQDDDGVDVTFTSGRSERFAAVVVAEGRSSRTRRLLMADRTRSVDKGMNVAYGTVDRLPSDDDWWYSTATTGGRQTMIRPDNLGTMRAALSFPSPPMGFETLPVEAQLHVLRETFRGAGPGTDRILDGFAARPGEFYTERIAQVVVDGWSTGRVVLLGDAAWGSGPTGMGTTLSLVGAHVLAGEMGRERVGGDLPAAFVRYEHLLRRYVDAAQGLPPGLPRLAHPTSSAGLTVLRGAHRLVAGGPVSRLVERTLITRQRHEPVLPEYPRLRAGQEVLSRPVAG